MFFKVKIKQNQIHLLQAIKSTTPISSEVAHNPFTVSRYIKNNL